MLCLFPDGVGRRVVPALVSYAVGALLGVALLDLVPEASVVLGTRRALWRARLKTVCVMPAAEQRLGDNTVAISDSMVAGRCGSAVMWLCHVLTPITAA